MIISDDKRERRAEAATVMFQLASLVLAACVAASLAATLVVPKEPTNYRNAPDLKPTYGALANSIFRRPDASTGELVAKYDPLTATINPEELGSYAAGDILVPGQTGRNGLVASSARWPKGRIPFVIGSKFGNDYSLFIISKESEFANVKSLLGLIFLVNQKILSRFCYLI